MPDGEPERLAWRESVRERLHRFGHQRLGWPDGYRRLLFGDAFYESAVAFAREARALDPRLTMEQVGQALRNVWIGNSLQMLLDRPVELRPGLFGYSMLYPVTDNWLDDPAVSGEAKRAFNERFGRRLAGIPVIPADERDRMVGLLVGRIEEEFARDRFPSVYASLLAIHDGQIRSLAQHGGIGLTDTELLSISFAKGGSSVLTDVFLVTGIPKPLEEQFAFGYGVFLQLLDDLQDVEADLAAGHETLFTRAARVGPLDEVTARLARFIDTLLAKNGLFEGPAFADRLDLIRRNCQSLLVGSVAEHPRRFTRRFRRHLALQWPISFRAYRRLRRRALGHWHRAQASAARQAFENEVWVVSRSETRRGCASRHLRAQETDDELPVALRALRRDDRLTDARKLECRGRRPLLSRLATRHPHLTDVSDSRDGFRIDKVALSGAAGAFVAVGSVAILVLGVPSLRLALVAAVVVGGVFGAGLVLFRRRSG